MAITKTNRREFLKIVGATTAAVALSSRNATAQRKAKSCVIIGSGLAGLSAGFKLKNAGWDVTILEARNRMKRDLSAEVYNVTRNTNKGFGVDGISNFCTGSSALADTANPLSISCPAGFFPSIRAEEPMSAPSTARFGGPRQLQLGVRFSF